MEYLNTNSLSQTIDNISEALLFGFDIDKNEKEQIADFLLERHSAAGAYANMFAPTDPDMKQDLILFTGEKIKSNAGRRHMMGEEASRILYKIELKSNAVITALRESDESIATLMKKHDSPLGTYCCKTCSCSLWLNISSGGLNYDSDMLKAGLEFLKLHRETKGTWKGFPYFYTLYVLNEIDPELAIDELRFAAKSILRWINRKRNEETKYILRRKFIGEAILNKVH